MDERKKKKGVAMGRDEGDKTNGKQRDVAVIIFAHIIIKM